MDLIHIVASTKPINRGVWHACLLGKEELMNQGVRSHFWTCSQDDSSEVLDFIFLDLRETKIREFIEGIETHFPKDQTLIITHGAWLNPTRIGFYAAKAGFKWIYVPQGMLEPWSLALKAWFKKPYFRFFEGRYIRQAKAIRAVSPLEMQSLKILTGLPVFYIPNSAKVGFKTLKSVGPIQVVFLGRIHFKKGLLPLVKAWDNTLKSHSGFRLKIAGPDDGELEKLRPYLKGNIEYLGPLYGENKEKLLSESHYYILPSFSEGLPSSLLEAMSFGAIPLISKGCNFMEVFENNLGYQAEPNSDQLIELLKNLENLPYNQNMSNANVDWISNHYSEERIAQNLLAEYRNILSHV